MSDPLLIVDAAYATRGGVELSPRIVPNELGRGPIAVRLERPDGSTSDASAELVFAHISGPKPPFALVKLAGLTERDVPVGTRVFVRST